VPRRTVLCLCRWSRPRHDVPSSCAQSPPILCRVRLHTHAAVHRHIVRVSLRIPPHLSRPLAPPTSGGHRYLTRRRCKHCPECLLFAPKDNSGTHHASALTDRWEPATSLRLHGHRQVEMPIVSAFRSLRCDRCGRGGGEARIARVREGARAAALAPWYPHRLGGPLGSGSRLAHWVHPTPHPEADGGRADQALVRAGGGRSHGVVVANQ